MRPNAFAGTFSVALGALRLLGRHWPVLFALALAGYIGRQGFMMLAVQATKIHAVVGILVFAFVPLSMFMAFLLMLRVLRGSPSDDSPNVFGHFASVLVPFLAVYASYGYLSDDASDYSYYIFEDAVLSNENIFTTGVTDNAERQGFGISVIMLSVAAAAFVLKWLLDRISRARSLAVLGISRGYLEATWMVLSVVTLGTFREPVLGWVGDRTAVAWMAAGKDAVVAAFGPLSGAADAVLAWVGAALGSVDTIIIVPLAWLTIGCVVYGRELAEQPAAADRWQRLPRPVRAVLTPVRNDARDRFGPMVGGFRTLTSAGLPTMLLFCLAFVVAQAVPYWLWELERLIVGPRDLTQIWMPISGMLGSVNFAVQDVLIACLVAAATQHVLRTDTQPSEIRELSGTADPYRDRSGVARGREKDRRAVVG